MTRAVIFDIDGTLSDPTHRLHHVRGGNHNWDAFFAAMDEDGVHEPIAELALKLARTDAVILCSGRPETYRAETEAWLAAHTANPFNELYMRPADDHRPDYIVKAELLAQMRADGYEPWLVIDDRPSVVKMWREAGLTCLQCRDWDEQPAVKPGLLTLMVGPSGAGKTFWLHHSSALVDYGIRDPHVISSDQIRADLCGDWRDQSRNDDVFAALHAVVRARVHAGLPTVVDATNLRRKDRLAVVGLAPAAAPVRYIVIDRPMDEKRRDAGWRSEVVGADGQPFDLIGKHDQTFRSQLKDILTGDGLPNVKVIDLRRA